MRGVTVFVRAMADNFLFIRNRPCPSSDEIEDLQLVPAPGLWAFIALNVLLQCVGVVAIGAAICAGRLLARERCAGRFGGSFGFR